LATLLDKGRGRLFSVFLGALEVSQEVADAVPPKHRSGGWHLLSQIRLARCHEDRVAKHAHHVAATLTELLRRRPCDRLLIGGPPEAGPIRPPRRSAPAGPAAAARGRVGRRRVAVADPRAVAAAPPARSGVRARA
jgi:hypothetical protein